ncbi:MAG: hypothetical protein AAGG75_11820 [Bacteroidota bacterium]
MRDDLRKKLKNKLGDHKSKWDKEGLWAKMEPAIPTKEEKKRRPFFWWLLPGLLLIGAMSYWLLLEDPGTLAPTHTTAFNETTTTKNDQQASMSLFAPVITEATTTIVTNPTPQTVIRATPPATLAEPPKPAIRKTEILSSATAPEVSVSPSTTNSPVHPTALAPLDEAGIVFDQVQPRAMKTSIAVAPPALSPLGSLQALPLLSIQSIAQPPAATLDATLLDLAPPSPWHLSGELLFGVGRPFRQLTSSHTDLHTALNHKADREVLLESLHAKALLTLHHRNGFFFRSGLELIQFNERFTITDTIRHNIRVLSDTAFVSYFSGVQFFADSVDAVQFQERKIEHFNQHRFVQLPLLVGYEKRFGKLAIDLHGGVAFGLHYHFSGRFSDLEGVIMDEVALENRSYFERGVRMGFVLGSNGSFRLGRRYSLIAGVAFQYNPSSLVSAAEGFEQRYHAVNLQVGIRKRLW